MNYSLEDEWISLIALRILEISLICIVYKNHIISIMGINSPFKVIKELFLGLFIALAGLGAFFALNKAAGALYGQELMDMLQLGGGQNKGHLPLEMIIAAIFIGPFAEELFFRGVLVHHIQKGRTQLFSKILYDLFLSFLFVWPHLKMKQDLALVQQLPEALIWTCCALTTLQLYHWRQSIISSWVLHASANACLFSLAAGYWS
ncbi:MAG: CPBP family intramembrane metalloprotease [Planctomycetes bacterium]|nr:CPBP family intramembrane metalloprotease [Planctomycetota bacterium]